MDHRFIKWKERWLPVLDEEITILFHHRQIFWRLQKIKRNNCALHENNSFFTFLARSYTDSAMIGMRRQIKIDDSSISLARLLSEIKETSHLVSREQFVQMYLDAKLPEHVPNEIFDRYGNSHIDPDKVANDLSYLRGKARACEKWADKRVAHYDKGNVSPAPLFQDLNGAINAIGTVFKKYDLVLRGSDKPLMPIDLTDWEDVFRVPWITEE